MTDICGIACDTVGSYHQTLLSQVSVVSMYTNYNGSYLKKNISTYVSNSSIITDYRVMNDTEKATKLKRMENGQDILEVAVRVAVAVSGKTLIGYFLHDDLKLLGITHPLDKCIDLANYGLIKRDNGGQFVPYKKLAKIYLKETIADDYGTTLNAVNYCNIYRKVHDLGSIPTNF